jgi:hypothetical protein
MPENAFWRGAVAEKHVFDLDLGGRPLVGRHERVATAGSCFAQHIGHQLRARGTNYVDLEPAPAELSATEAVRFGYGLFSCRYGNIYTTRQLRQLLEEALGERTPHDVVWQRDLRCFDALRPSVDPAGHDSPDDVIQLRRLHLRSVRQLLTSMDVFVFTLGLTEAWCSRVDGTIYPSAPGVIAGRYDPNLHAFVNFRYPEVMGDLQAVWTLLRSYNPQLRMILTVSPVSLKATASGDHVLVANMQSKSTLRAVAGDLAAAEPDISYFPSYELIVGHASRAMFFEPDLRSVNQGGVDYVMSKFFGGTSVPRERNGINRQNAPAPGLPSANFDLICDEDANDPN